MYFFLKCKRLVTLSLFLFLPVFCFASDDSSPLFPSKSFYFGVNMGGGSTEWKYLVDKTDLSGQTDSGTPTNVSEGGPSWGVVFGYDVSKNFAIELQYMQFANATIYFAPGSSYMYADGTNILSIVSKTHAFSLSGKFFVRIAKTHLRAFSAIGAGLVIRRDILVNYDDDSGPYLTPPPFSNVDGQDGEASCITPYVSAGLNYSFSRHWMIESGFQYYTGFGKSQLTPVSSFIPFAWDAYGRLAYQLSAI